MTIKKLQLQSYECAKQHGWHDPVHVPEKLALIHSEVSEVLEEYRNDNMKLYWENVGPVGLKPCGFGIELADIMIRVADLAQCLGIDLEEMIEIKMNYNRCRPYRHGDKKA